MISVVRYALAVLLALCVSAVLAQGVPPGEWSPQESQWVNDARELYRKQGLNFTDVQAGSAIAEMRAKGQPRRAVPRSEWTPMEQHHITVMRQLYEQGGMRVTQEQEELAVAKLRERTSPQSNNIAMLLAMAGAKANAGSPTGSGEQHSEGALTEEQLGARLAAFPVKSENLDVKGRRDGFDVNGRPFVDPEGRVNVYAFNVLTGDATYVAQVGPQHIVKTTRLGTGVEPVRIATATKNPSGQFEVTSVTGKKLTGDALFPVPNGILVTREAAAFYYQPGKGIQNIAPPSGYRIARIQRGDVGSTRYVLLEKEGAESNMDTATGLNNSLRDLGRMFGMTTKEDYALMNLDTGKLHSLNIQVDGKMVMQMYNCRKRNSFVNECRDAVTKESLYQANGGPNMSHYFWKVYWMETPHGPIAITMENGFKDIFVLDLKSGKKVVAFNRPLGIQDFVVEQQGDGRVGIKARWMFQVHELADAVAHLNQQPEGVAANVQVATDAEVNE